MPNEKKNRLGKGPKGPNAGKKAQGPNAGKKAQGLKGPNAGKKAQDANAGEKKPCNKKAGAPGTRKRVVARIKKHDLAIQTITKKLAMIRKRVRRLGKSATKTITFKLIPMSGMPVGAFVDVIYNPNKGSPMTLHLNVTNFERAVTVGDETHASWTAACADSTYEPVVDSGSVTTTKSQTVVLQMAKTVQMVQFDATFPTTAPNHVKVNVDYNPDKGADVKFSLTAKTGGEYYAIQLGDESTATYTVTLPSTVADNANYVLAVAPNTNQVLNSDGTISGSIGAFPKAVTNIPIQVNSANGCG